MQERDTSNIIRGTRAPEKIEQARRFRDEMTPVEARLWEYLRCSRLGGLHFRRQQIIDGFIVDFYCHTAAVVVELDGPVHGGTTAYDAERSAILERRGPCVLRFPNQRVEHDIDAVLSDIGAACAARIPAGVPARRRRTAAERRRGVAQQSGG